MRESELEAAADEIGDGVQPWMVRSMLDSIRTRAMCVRGMEPWRGEDWDFVEDDHPLIRTEFEGVGSKAHREYDRLLST